MRKILLFTLMLTLLFVLIGCGNTVELSDTETSADSTADAAESITEPALTDTEKVTEAESDAVTTDAPEPEFMSIDNIGEYVVIRSADSSVAVKNAATDLCADIYVDTDILLSVKTDKQEEKEFEILIGKTNRVVDGFDFDSLGMGEYTIKKIGGKIIIAGGSESSLKNAIKYFALNCISETGINLPISGEYTYAPNDYIDSITVDGVSIQEYRIIEDLYDDDVAEDFSQKLESIIFCSLPLESSSELKDYGEKYILLSDTNTDFTTHSVRIENGNIILSANYKTIGECIDYFFTGLLGYDIREGNLIGDKDIKLTSGSEKIFNVEKKQPYSRDKLLQVLTDVYNSDKIIVGQHMYAHRYGETLTTERQLYMDNLGVDCPLFGFDVAEAQTAGSKYPWNAQVKDAYDMVEYAREGGIFTFSVHFPNPSGLPEGLAAYRGELGDGTAAAWDQLLSAGTEYNLNFMESLRKVGDFLEIFHSNGVPVIFRPLHEMNGNWFWFCIVNGEQNNTIPREYAVRLWILIYDYLVKERGIDSMIWEYSPNVAAKTSSTMVDVMYCYPGDEYCDIVGCDWYTSSYRGHDVLSISEQALSQTGKIFSVTEFGPGDVIRTDYSRSDKDMFTCLHLDDLITEVTDSGIKTCYWLLWSSWAQVRISMWNMGDGHAFYGNSSYLTLEDTYKLLYE